MGWMALKCAEVVVLCSEMQAVSPRSISAYLVSPLILHYPSIDHYSPSQTITVNGIGVLIRAAGALFIAAAVDYLRMFVPLHRQAAAAGTVLILTGLMPYLGMILNRWRRTQVGWRLKLKTNRKPYEGPHCFQVLMESVIDAIVICDDAWRVVGLNTRAVDMSGYSRAEILTMTFPQLCTPEIGPILDRIGEQLTWTGSADAEITQRRKDGSLLNLETSFRVMEAEGKKLRLAIVCDLTERLQFQYELERSRDLLERAQWSLHTAREDERAAIGRELHDDLGQLIAGVKLDIVLLERNTVPAILPGRRLDFVRNIVAICRTIDGCVQSLRNIVKDLRPTILSTVALEASLELSGAEFTRQTGVSCRVDVIRPPKEISSEHSTVIRHMFQELLTNVRKHAKASSVEASLFFGDEEIRFEVKDNGCGFDASRPSSPDSFGLRGIRETAMRLSGTMNVRSQIGEGTTVVIGMPLHARQVLTKK